MNKSLSILTLSIAAAALSGCQATKWSKPTMQNLNPLKLTAHDKESSNKADPDEPASMAAIWSDGVYEAVGNIKVAGFGARIYFYNDAGEPVNADGELTVYGYEDDKQQGGTSADRKFVFRQSEFQSHYSETSLGASYSVWVPWQKVGGQRTSISLIPVFKTSAGKVLRGDESVNVVPGVDPETHEVIKSDIKISKDVIQLGIEGCLQHQVRTAAYEQDVAKPGVAQQSTNKSKRPSTTIFLPKSMADKLAAGRQQISFPESQKEKPKKQDDKKTPHKTISPPPETTPTTESKPIRTFGLPGQ